MFFSNFTKLALYKVPVKSKQKFATLIVLCFKNYKTKNTFSDFLSIYVAKERVYKKQN